MLTVDQARKIEPALQTLSDEQVMDILKDMYDLSQLAFEKWVKEKKCSKNLTRVLSMQQ